MSPGHGATVKTVKVDEKSQHSRAASKSLMKSGFIETGSMSLKKNMALERGEMQSQLALNKYMADHRTINSRA